MEAERQSHNVKEFCSDLTALSDPQWQARRQLLPGNTADAYGTREYPHKRQAVSHELPDHACMDEACCAQSSSHLPARAFELQCCAQPGPAQQTHQQSGHEQQRSLQSSSVAGTVEAASSRFQHASWPPGCVKQESNPGTSLSLSSEHNHDGQAMGLPPAAEAGPGSSKQGEHDLSFIMEDDGGYVIPVLLTDLDIRMPVSMPARAPRPKAEPETQPGRPRRSRAAALACQVRPPLEHHSCMAYVQNLSPSSNDHLPVSCKDRSAELRSHTNVVAMPHGHSMASYLHHHTSALMWHGLTRWSAGCRPP